MSYLVEFLILNKDTIRSRNDIENDEYNDLLLVEKTLKELLQENRITQEEYDILYEVSEDGKFVGEQITRQKKSRLFRRVCNRIGFEIGGYFTDEGYINYMSRKYSLDSEHIEVLREYMKSNLRHRNLRRKYRIND